MKKGNVENILIDNSSLLPKHQDLSIFHSPHQFGFGFIIFSISVLNNKLFDNNLIVQQQHFLSVEMSHFKMIVMIDQNTLTWSY